MEFFELQDRINKLAEEFISGMKEVESSEIQIDYRAAFKFFVSADGIACHVSRLGSVEYYGGFEYERDYKTHIGEYVFWSIESSRVRSHLSHLPEFSYLEEYEE